MKKTKKAAYENTLEKQIENDLRKRVENAGGLAIKGNVSSVTGMPDRWVLMPGKKCYPVEVKRMLDGKPTPLSPRQRITHKQLVALGFKVWVIYDYPTLNEFISYILNEQP